MTDEHGVPTEYAPPWLRMVHADAQMVLPMWTGFREEWRDTMEHECNDEVLDDYLVQAQPHLHFPGAGTTTEEPSPLIQEPFRCPDCTNTFKTDRGRQNHWRLVHGRISTLTEAKCPICQRKFATVKIAREHMKPKRDGQPSCGKKITNPLAVELRGEQGASVRPPRQPRLPVQAPT